jgi:hypothetical protein
MEKNILKLTKIKKFSYEKYFINKKYINFDPDNKIFVDHLKKDLN